MDDITAERIRWLVENYSQKELTLALIRSVKYSRDGTRNWSATDDADFLIRYYWNNDED